MSGGGKKSGAIKASKSAASWRAKAAGAAEVLLGDKLSLACALFVILAAAACIAAPILAPYGYDAQDLALGASAPSLEHPFGTDMLGRDLLSRILYGGRVSFAVGALATLVAAVIGVSYVLSRRCAGGGRIR